MSAGERTGPARAELVTVPAQAQAQAGPARRRSGERRRRAAIGASLQVAVCAVVLGLLLDLRYGYSAGRGDHTVLSPVGLHWAHPDWFANDWSVLHATQPHWFFDLETWLGASIGLLSEVYLAHWILSLVVFGTATVLLAREWCPRHATLAAVAATIITALTPTYLLGAGTPVLAIALPEVLGGFLTYLFVAAIVTGRPRVAWAVAPVTAVIHVQLGVVVAGLAVALIAVEWFRSRKVQVLPVASVGVSLALCAFGMIYRPVAGSFKDFAYICNTLIPYHCAPATWTPADLDAGLAALGLSLMTGLFVARDRLAQWAALFVLPATVLVAGVYAARWHVPIVGLIAQGTNVFRFDAMLALFAPWALIVPLLRPNGRLPLLAAPAVALFYVATGGRSVAWAIGPAHGGLWMFAALAGAGLAVLAAYAGGPRRGSTRAWAARGGVALALVGVLASAAQAGTLAIAHMKPERIGFSAGNDPTDQWGRRVEQIVPVGAQILAPPTEVEIRMATHRAVLADCKYLPYGGAPWAEFLRRINSLGGLGQCAGGPGYGSLTPAQLEAAGREYGAHYAVIVALPSASLSTLTDRGWVVLLPPTTQLHYAFLRLPSAAATAR